MSKPLVSIVMGSDSDLDIMREAAKALEDFGIAYEIDVTSAHRSPDRTADYARKAAGRGIRVIIAGAGGELQLTDGLRGLLKREKLYAYVYEGRRHDTGDKLGFLKATVEFALKRDDLGAHFRDYLKSLKL